MFNKLLQTNKTDVSHTKYSNGNRGCQNHLIIFYTENDITIHHPIQLDRAID